MSKFIDVLIVIFAVWIFAGTAWQRANNPQLTQTQHALCIPSSLLFRDCKLGKEQGDE